jgi:hypothetical protein
VLAAAVLHLGAVRLVEARAAQPLDRIGDAVDGVVEVGEYAGSRAVCPLCARHRI